MEQTKNETRIEGNTGNTAMPDNKGKPEKERKPLTEAQRLQRQKMIVLPVMVLVFINPEKPDVPLNKNDAFQKVQKRHVQEKR